MDVIACHRAGVPAVAAMGTALGEDQMEVLWRHHAEPTLCFDGDRAGRQAAARVMDRAVPLLKAGRSFRFAMVEGGKDPDEVLREHGAAALKSQLSRTTPFAEALFLRERDVEALDTPERRTALKVRLRKLADDYDPTDRDRAYAHVREHQRAGEVVTGLLYLAPNSQDLHDQIGTVPQPLVELPYEQLCPGNAELQKLQGRFR